MTINGFDISHHNVDFDWAQHQDIALNNDLYFAYIKAIEGTANVDATFASHWPAATAHGFIRGAYHFFLPALDPVAQANAFIAQVGQLEPGDLPPALDVEWTEIKRADGSIARAEQWDAKDNKANLDKIMAWVNTIKDAMGLTPLIYTASVFWKTYLANNTADDLEAIAACPLWLVNYNPAVPKPIALWPQHTVMQVSGGLVPPKGSIYDNLDHNMFNGDTKSLLNLCAAGAKYRLGAPKSAIVRDIQQKLMDLDAQKYNTNGIDGEFGNGTLNAITAFQADQGLSANGIIDVATWTALFA